MESEESSSVVSASEEDVEMEEINNKGEDQYLDEKSDDHDDSEEECSVSEEEYMSGSNSTSENETNENSGCEADKNYNPETDPEYGGESDVSNMDVAVSSDDSNDKTVDGMYKCKTCNNSYRNKTQFDRHLKTHTGQTPYNCTFCSRTFASKGELKSHIGRFHSGERVRKYVCPIATCGKRFFEKHYLKQHVRIHSGIKPFECKVCNKGFIDIRRYNIHMRLHTGECMFSCDVCERKYLTMNALKSHMNTHTKETEYKCDICNKIFFVKGSLDKHRRIHFEDRPYKCSVCGKGFKQNSAMHTHEETHKPVELRKPKRKIEKNHECNICLKKYPTHISMLRHIRIHTGEYLKCKFCDKQFTQDDSYQVHLRNHTKQFTHKCDVCGKGFACTNYLTRHMRIHTGEKRYKCEYCGDSFTQSAARNRHLKVHTGERPYKCDVCGRLYKDKHSMKTHAKSHTEDPKKNFTCDICNKGLTTKYGLSCHLKAVHGQGKPEHECQVCGKTFTMRSYLVVHLKNHVEINKSKCTLCGKTFKSDPALQNHIRLVHEVDRPYDCDRCHAGFSSQSNLKQHKESQIYILEGQELLEIKSSDWGRLDELVENLENPLKCMECGKIWTSKKRFKIHLCNMHEYNNNDKVQDQVDNEVQDQSFEEALKSAISETLQVDKTKQSSKITNEDEDTIDFSQFYLDQVEESQTEDLDLINIGNNIDPDIQHFGHISKEVTETVVERNSREKSLLGKDSEITCKEEPLDNNVNISEKNPRSTVTKKILAETVKNKTYQTQVQTVRNTDDHDSNLVKHVKVFKCSACKKEFKTQKSLKNHMFSHEKSYLFSCQICNKGFNWEDHLERHMKIHE